MHDKTYEYEGYLINYSSGGSCFGEQENKKVTIRKDGELVFSREKIDEDVAFELCKFKIDEFLGRHNIPNGFIN